MTGRGAARRQSRAAGAVASAEAEAAAAREQREAAEQLGNRFAAVLQNLADVVSPLPDAAAGYRAEMLRRGFSEQNAEACAVAYHSAALQLFTASVAGE